MSERNGLAVSPAQRKPFRVVQATKRIAFDTGDGVVELDGYVRGPGCPLSVTLEVNEIAVEAAESRPSDEERATLTPRRLLLRLTRTVMLERRDLLLAVIPGLSMDQANILANDDGGWHEILTDLGWWVDVPDETEAGDAADPEATAPAVEQPTGAPDSPDSSPATASIP